MTPVRNAVRIGAIAAGMAVWAGGAGSAVGLAATKYPLKVNNCGRTVTMQHAPKRILTDGSNAVNMVVAAGGVKRIAARAGEYGAPLSAAARGIRSVPIISKTNTVTAEQVVGQHIDLLIIRPNDAGAGLVDKLSAAGITTLYPAAACSQLKPPSKAATDYFNFVYADLRLYGRLFSKPKTAGRTVAELFRRVQAFKANKLRAKTAAEIQIFGGVPYGSGSGTMADTQIRKLGLRNVFGNQKPSFTVSVERLVALNPDVLILQQGFGEGKNGHPKTLAVAKAEFLALPGVKAMRAARTGSIVGVPTSEIQPDPLALNGMQTIARQLRAG
jgi:iron complex transport system substrate-binding protein